MKDIIDLTEKTNAQIDQLVKDRAAKAYDAGPGWGKAADSLMSVHKRHFLSTEDLAMIDVAKIEAYNRLHERLAPLRKSELNRNGWMEKYNEEYLAFPQWFKDKYPGVVFRVKGLSCRTVRGRRIYDICKFDDARLCLNKTVSVGWRYAAEKRFDWGKDEQGRTYIDFICWPTSTEIPEEKKRRNWARIGKCNEFKKTSVDFIRGLIDSGYMLKAQVEEYNATEVMGVPHRYVTDWYLLMEKPVEEKKNIVPEHQAPAVEIRQEAVAEKQVAKPADDGAMTICFTGTLASMGRREAAFRATKAGLKVCSSVKAGLTFLVMADPDSMSTKAVKARDLGIRRLSEHEFTQMLKFKGA